MYNTNGNMYHFDLVKDGERSVVCDFSSAVSLEGTKEVGEVIY